MTLRFKNRIAFFNVIAVAITVALVFAVIYAVVTKTAYDHLDQDIVLEKEEVISNLDWHRDSIVINKMPEWDEAEHKKVEVNPTFLQIVDTKGTIIFRSSNLLEGIVLFDPKNNKETYFDGEINGQKVRVGQFPIRNGANKIIGQLSVAISEQESYGILNNLLIILLVSFPVVLVIQFIVSSFAASKAIKPVHQLIKTTAAISDTTSGVRLSLPEHQDELFELTQTINDFLNRIEASMLQQKQFTSDASHEIRTPLAAIRGTLEVLIRKEREPKDYEEKITTVIAQVDRINHLLDQLLQLSRLESGVAAVKKEKIALQKFASTLQEKWSSVAEAKNIAITIEVSEHAVVWANPFHLELILDNLVSNAIKYGKFGGTIHFHWYPDQHTLELKDDGMGIPATHLDHIFNRFYRVDESRNSTIPGNGLGLAIVKRLAELQAIDLRVQSVEKMGTTFSLTFPNSF